MKTDDFVSMLAARAGPVDTGTTRRRYTAALLGGAILSLLILALGMEINPDLAQVSQAPMFWVKLAYTLALAGAALALAVRMSRPGARAQGTAAALALPLLAIWLLSAYALGNAAADEREALIYGRTWSACPFNIALLSAPLFVVVLWAMRGLAPTRPVLAGAAAGLLSGAVAATLYCLHCPELGAPFLALWYPLGMLIPAAAGAIAGPRLLRW